jgi:hypothetical protein
VINPKEIQEMSVTETKAASVYLNDQLADETRGLALIMRAISEHRGTRLGTFLELLSWELEEDRASLVALMSLLGVRRKHVAVDFAGIAGKVGRRRHGSLAELEALDLRIKGKLDMWKALRSGVGDRVDGIDFDELIRRTERQVEALERRRLDVAHRDGSVAAHMSSTPLLAAS